MSSCEVGVKLERGVVRAGEEIVGVIQVRTGRPCTCRSLAARLLWRVEGECEPEETPVAEGEVFSGSWEAGAEASYPFAIPAPDGPYTFRGASLRLEWHLEATARLADEVSAGARAELRLEPAEGTIPRIELDAVGMAEELKDPEGVQVDRSTDGDVSIELTKPWHVATAGLVANLVAAVIAYFEMQPHHNWQGGYDEGGFDIWIAIIIGGVLGPTVVAFVRSLQRTRVRRGRRAVDVEITQDEGMRTVRCRLVVHPEWSRDVTSLAASLVALEVTRPGPTRSLDLGSEAFRAEGAVKRSGGGQGSFEASFQMPSTPPYSFDGTRCRLAWLLAVEIEAPGRAPAREVFPLRVLPGAGSPGAAAPYR